MQEFSFLSGQEPALPESGGDRAAKGSLSSIEDYGSITLRTARATVHIITIVGQIEGHTAQNSSTKTTKYEHIIPQLAAIEQSPNIDGLLILLNTVGGDVEAGLAIAEMIASLSMPTVSLVLGGSHSIGVPLAVSAQTSFIAPSAAMTIHPVRLSGTVIAVSQTFAYFSRIQDRIIDFVTRNSHIKREDFTRLMLQTGELTTDVGSVLYGEQAVELARSRADIIITTGGLGPTCDDLTKKRPGRGFWEKSWSITRNLWSASRTTPGAPDAP